MSRESLFSSLNLDVRVPIESASVVPRSKDTYIVGNKCPWCSISVLWF